jgi:hypothetical protein
MLPASVRKTFEVVEAELALHVLLGQLDAPALLDTSYESTVSVLVVIAWIPQQRIRGRQEACAAAVVPVAWRSRVALGPRASPQSLDP